MFSLIISTIGLLMIIGLLIFIWAYITTLVFDILILAAVYFAVYFIWGLVSGMVGDNKEKDK